MRELIRFDELIHKTMNACRLTFAHNIKWKCSMSKHVSFNAKFLYAMFFLVRSHMKIVFVKTVSQQNVPMILVNSNKNRNSMY